jgi:hypothetical protein
VLDCDATRCQQPQYLPHLLRRKSTIARDRNGRSRAPARFLRETDACSSFACARAEPDISSVDGVACPPYISPRADDEFWTSCYQVRSASESALLTLVTFRY